MTKATALQQTIRGGGYDAVLAALYGADRVAAQRIERKLQQVHGLRAGKYSAAAQYRIRTEKSADRGKRQVPVQIGIFIYKQYYRPVSIKIVPNEQK